MTMPIVHHIPRAQFVTVRRQSLRDAGFEGESKAPRALLAIALALRSANARTTRSADACDVQVDVEEKIRLVAAVGQVADKAGNGGCPARPTRAMDHDAWTTARLIVIPRNLPAPASPWMLL